jgi:hypothetical protein
MSSRIILTPIPLDDLDGLRSAVAQMIAIGGVLARVGRYIAERIDGLPDERLRRRNETLVAWAALVPRRSKREIARVMAAKLCNYECTRWKTEQMLDAAPCSQ